jgi:glycosyl transferase family 17
MIWDVFMYRDEAAMLEMRLEAFSGLDQVRHVLVEAPWTHRGISKPLHFDQLLHPADPGFIAAYLDDTRISPVVDDWAPDLADPWVNEHHQRNAAWKVIGREAGDEDWVLICDVDEIPNREFLRMLDTRSAGWQVLGVPMVTYLFAVDWEVTDRRVQHTATCVAARAGFLRDQAADGCYLAEVRDQRGAWPLLTWAGGWHFSWAGGPQAQAVKLDTATCHTEILRTPEAALIRSGNRWRSAENGGGLPVKPVTVDQTWPAYIHERRCPPEWFRPEGDTVDRPV